MAAVLWVVRLVFVTLNVLMGVLFVMTTTESCESVFEFRVGKLVAAKQNGFLSIFWNYSLLSWKHFL